MPARTRKPNSTPIPSTNREKQAMLDQMSEEVRRRTPLISYATQLTILQWLVDRPDGNKEAAKVIRAYLKYERGELAKNIVSHGRMYDAQAKALRLPPVAQSIAAHLEGLEQRIKRCDSMQSILNSGALAPWLRKGTLDDVAAALASYENVLFGIIYSDRPAPFREAVFAAMLEMDEKERGSVEKLLEKKALPDQVQNLMIGLRNAQANVIQQRCQRGISEGNFSPQFRHIIADRMSELGEEQKKYIVQTEPDQNAMEFIFSPESDPLLIELALRTLTVNGTKRRIIDAAEKNEQRLPPPPSPGPRREGTSMYG